MMGRFDISTQILKSFGFTTLFCFVIALTTLTIWEAALANISPLVLGMVTARFYRHVGLSAVGQSCHPVWSTYWR